MFVSLVGYYSLLVVLLLFLFPSSYTDNTPNNNCQNRQLIFIRQYRGPCLTQRCRSVYSVPSGALSLSWDFRQK